MSKCASCNKSVYPNDPKINLDSVVFHKECAKCKASVRISDFCCRYFGPMILGTRGAVYPSHRLGRGNVYPSYLLPLSLANPLIG